jgi:aminoglycoside phosphotransferase (APT) family kinase protein
VPEPVSAARPARRADVPPDLPARLGRVLATAFGGERRVRAVKARPSPFAGVWPADTVSVELERGGTVALWVKRLSADGDDHPDKSAPDREPRMYAELLCAPGLPVPRCYGCAHDPHTGERELVLEHIRDWDLRYQDIDTWELAVRALARLHGRFATRGDDLRDRGFLLRLDADYVRRWAHRAVDALHGPEPALARRLHARLDDYDDVGTLVGGQTPTLVHNDLAPKNVVADTAHDPPRICFIDWETAGVGCGGLDLVHLLHGLAPGPEQRLIEAYASEAGGALPSGEDRARLLTACRAHKTVFRLAHAPLWLHRREVARAWLDEIERDLSDL